MTHKNDSGLPIWKRESLPLASQVRIDNINALIFGSGRNNRIFVRSNGKEAEIFRDLERGESLDVNRGYSDLAVVSKKGTQRRFQSVVVTVTVISRKLLARILQYVQLTRS